MAFVCRTTRETNRVGLPSSSTGAAVGPGSYRVSNGFKPKGPSFAPFSSTADRSAAPSTAAAELVTPGPGSYQVAPKLGRMPASAAAAATPFMSFADRFKPPPASDVPGPGAYGVADPNSIAAKASKSRTAGPASPGGAAAAAAGPNAGPAVTWVRVPTAPSIPAPSQSYGYEEGQHGELTMQRPANPGHTGRGLDTAGPGAYDPDDTHLGSRTRAGVSQFSKSRTQRADFSKSSVAPGPGYYATNTVGPVIQSGKAKPTSVFASRVTRSAPGSELAAPGPGAYDPGAGFSAKYVPERQQFFGSTSRRFDDSRTRKTAGPGPGYYGTPDVTAKFRKQLKPTPAHVGFDATSARFQGTAKETIFETPGAGTYELPGMVDQLNRKISARNGVFGTTTKRFFTPSGVEMPGPGAYDGEVHASHRNQQAAAKKSSMFASTQDRFTSLSAEPEAPPPGAYDVDMSYKAKKSFSRAPGLIASGPQRFGSGGTVSKDQVAFPGPGAYTADSPASAAAKRRAPPASVAPRFMDAKVDVTPGPGAYDGADPYSGLVKRTFNMTIAAEEVGLSP